MCIYFSQIVIFALASYAHCNEAEERSDKYSYEKDNEINERSSKDSLPVNEFNNEYRYSYKGYDQGLNANQNTPNGHSHPVKEFNNEYSYSYKGYDQGLNTNQNTPNGHGQFVAISKVQSYPIKNWPTTNQLQQNPTYGYNNPLPYQVTYKSYPQTVKTFDPIPVKQNEETRFTNFANFPHSKYLTSYQMVAPKESRPFGFPPQIYERNNAGFGSNVYGSNQYKFAEQYSYKPTSWTELSNGVSNGFATSSNGLEAAKGYYSDIAAYGTASTNGNRFKSYTPVYAGHGIPSSNGYPVGNIGASSTFESNEYRSPKTLSYGSTNVGNELKYTNVVQPAQYLKPEYKPAMVSEHGSGFINGALTAKIPEFIPYGKQQYMYIVPKEYASTPSGSHGYNRQQFGNSFMYIPKSAQEYSTGYSSVPSFQSSLRDIVKMVSEEQRKSNGKVIFLIGKPQFPPHMLSNPGGYSAPSIKYGGNINANNGYKY